MQTYDRGDLGVTISDYVAEIEICRPPHNFLDVELIADIATVLEQLDAEPAARVAVLCSQGRSFCGGVDFSRPKSGASAAPASGPSPLYAAAIRLFTTRKPLIAAVQGPAIGGGLGLALAADFRVVEPDARFAANFVKIGIHPGFGITATLPKIVGAQRAALLMYTGRRLGGVEALEWGLADILAETGKVRETANALAREIAVNAPLAVAETRDTLRGHLADMVRRQTEIEAEKQARLFLTEDHKEGVAAVTARRPGDFRGC